MKGKASIKMLMRRIYKLTKNIHIVFKPFSANSTRKLNNELTHRASGVAMVDRCAKKKYFTKIHKNDDEFCHRGVF